MKWHEVFI